MNDFSDFIREKNDFLLQNLCDLSVPFDLTIPKDANHLLSRLRSLNLGVVGLTAQDILGDDLGAGLAEAKRQKTANFCERHLHVDRLHHDLIVSFFLSLLIVVVMMLVLLILLLSLLVKLMLFFFVARPHWVFGDVLDFLDHAFDRINQQNVVSLGGEIRGKHQHTTYNNSGQN